MEFILWAGSALGGVAGLLHAGYIYRSRPRYATNGRIAALYRGLWAFVLWVLFGTYVLLLWVVGVIAYAGMKALSKFRFV